ncbi:hypothetical protein DVH05_007514 [Phytophthora capsici]|nr:hypothetical protein DVH05_007514 [Phytophthora capsici]
MVPTGTKKSGWGELVALPRTQAQHEVVTSPLTHLLHHLLEDGEPVQKDVRSIEELLAPLTSWC